MNKKELLADVEDVKNKVWSVEANATDAVVEVKSVKGKDVDGENLMIVTASLNSVAYHAEQIIKAVNAIKGKISGNTNQPFA